jgi:hypothetical protein
MIAGPDAPKRSPKRSREEENRQEGPSKRARQVPYDSSSSSSSDSDGEPPAFPSAKALGKRRAVDPEPSTQPLEDVNTNIAQPLGKRKALSYDDYPSHVPPSKRICARFEPIVERTSVFGRPSLPSPPSRPTASPAPRLSSQGSKSRPTPPPIEPPAPPYRRSQRSRDVTPPGDFVPRPSEPPRALLIKLPPAPKPRIVRWSLLNMDGETFTSFYAQERPDGSYVPAPWPLGAGGLAPTAFTSRNKSGHPYALRPRTRTQSRQGQPVRPVLVFEKSPLSEAFTAPGEGDEMPGPVVPGAFPEETVTAEPVTLRRTTSFSELAYRAYARLRAQLQSELEDSDEDEDDDLV